MKQQRARDMGIIIGTLPTGARNKITDVPGVRVGHSTVRDENHKTGVTVILPCEDNVFLNKPVAAAFVHNGYGKTCGTVQIDELGTLETPIALTNTLNVGAVSDAIVQYMVKRCEEDGHPLRSVNPIVGECNDSALNTITDRPITAEHVFVAIEAADGDFAEGDIGAGTGTTCYGYKGGIGSASRKISLDGKEYTLGVLVQSNYGAMQDLRINGKAPADLHDPEPPCDKGSIMIILATDVPLTARQLKRVIKRCSIGIARLGSYIGHGSGEVFIGFTTANRIPVHAPDILSLSAISEDKIDLLFRAAGEASEEAILNSMLCADAAVALNGHLIPSLRDTVCGNDKN